MQFKKSIFILPVIGCMFLCPPVFAAYTDNGDGTVSDTCAGFMWQKDIKPVTAIGGKRKDYCANLSLAGYSNWRIPTVWELSIIIDSSIQYPCSTRTTNYPGETSQFNYWTSTRLPNGWKVIFYSGSMHSTKEREEAVTVLRCVRDLD